MAACDACGTSILFGGVTVGDRRYCNKGCAQRGEAVHNNSLVPETLVEDHARQIHQGNCPDCGGPGPVDVHTSHSVYSFIVMTRWASKPQVCCRSCGRKKQLVAAASSAVLGWWGFPWGFIMTPIQVTKNLAGIVGIGGPDPSTPSGNLRKLARLNLINRVNTAASRTIPTPKPPPF